jgi:RecB family exonuclease
VWSSLAAVAPMVADPDRREERADWGAISTALRRWNERNPASTLAEYRRLTEEEEFEARPLLSRRPENQQWPTITTLHQSKGLEFDVVFIADAVEGVFPDLRSRDSLLGVRHVLEHLPTDAAGYRAFRLQEERRLAYTAMSRARTRVVWTATATGFEEGRGIPSRFLALVAGTATVSEAVTSPPIPLNPVTPREAEGALRRLLQDPAASAPHRLAALTVLAERRDDRMRDPLQYAGMRHRGSDDGVLPRGPRLSPSQAESYARCPRRYVLERRLKIGPRTSVYLGFGSLIHDVLEKVEQSAIDGGRPHASHDEAVAAFEAAFDESVYGGPPFSDAWRARGHEAIERLYGNWPSEGSVVAVEHPLEMDLGGVTWHGRADRLELSDDRITIVDYKTSRSAATTAEAGESLQLGFYLLAALESDSVSSMGAPSAAEMWYPAMKGASVTRRSFDTANLELVEARLEEAAAGITREDWTPQPGPQCDRCPQRAVCPAWFESREAFV